MLPLPIDSLHENKHRLVCVDRRAAAFSLLDQGSCMCIFFPSDFGSFTDAGEWTPFLTGLLHTDSYLHKVKVLKQRTGRLFWRLWWAVGSRWSDTMCLTDSRSFTWWPPASAAFLQTRCIRKPGQMFVAAGPLLCSPGIILFVRTQAHTGIAVICLHHYAPDSPHNLCS